MKKSGRLYVFTGRKQEGMLVEQIQKVTDRKKKVVLEDGFSFVLYTAEIRKYAIREGADLPDGVREEILREVLDRRAKKRCMNLLKTSDRTVKQLTDRLRRDGYPEEVISSALSYVSSYHYTDDGRYAENYIRYHAERKSMKVIRLELQKRGISPEQIERACAALDAENPDGGLGRGGSDEKALKRLLEKKHFDVAEASWDERQKMTAYLARKGFSMEDIRRALCRE